jgi:two-component system chemotaxis sensor kinase CheA
MGDKVQELTQLIDSLALDTVVLDPEDIPGLGKILKSMDSIETAARKVNEKSLKPLVGAMKGYIEKIIMREESDLSPFEKGISQLQNICRCATSGKGFETDISSLLISLGFERIDQSPVSPRPQKGTDKEAEENFHDHEGAELREEGDIREQEEEVSGIMTEEDKEIINDFVAESLENFEAIEVKLMDLEQEPSDIETINAIFRPFHTVKGVSGFLNFKKINKLAHTTENLLDKARNGELSIDEGIIDVILDSVDTLKRMIENVQRSLGSAKPSEGDTDIEGIIFRIERLMAQVSGEGEKKPLGEMLIARDMISEVDLEKALDIQKKEQDKRIGEILVEQKKVETKEVVSALREQKKSGQPVSLQAKVDIGKLDSVVDMVGELAIAQSMLRQSEVIKKIKHRKLDGLIGQLSQITSGLQRMAMSLRMVPIRNTFQKMVRLVRDLAKKAGKEVQLIMSGEDTEIDRNMVEEIYEPIVHMIRNSIDHGLERPEEREAADKPRQGTIYLKAYHEKGNIVIEIEDDGQGLHREKILEKARSNGLIGEDENLTDRGINNLIFQPGFSTAEKITEISGRGVGMDVVKSRIVDRLRGDVEVHSSWGRGTRFLIRLPLTLAIIDGMVVSVSGERYIIPTLTVQESFRPTRAHYHTVQREGEMIMVRDTLVPLIRLDHLLGLNGGHSSKVDEPPPWERLVVVVENQEKRRCLLVDELLGQEEVVIKSLGKGLKDVKGIAGGAIRGDGRISLILDIAGIFSIASEE